MATSPLACAILAFNSLFKSESGILFRTASSLLVIAIRIASSTIISFDRTFEMFDVVATKLSTCIKDAVGFSPVSALDTFLAKPSSRIRLSLAACSCIRELSTSFITAFAADKAPPP